MLETLKIIAAVVGVISTTAKLIDKINNGYEVGIWKRAY